MAFNLEHIARIKADKKKYSNFISMYCVERNARTGNDWDRIMALTPLNTVLNKVIDATRAGTDFPHQIGFFATLHYLAGWALGRDIHIDFNGQKIYPDIWSVMLAPSGSGKSTVEKFVRNTMAKFDIPKVEAFATSKAFLQNLEKTPKGLLVKDEYAQLLKNIEIQTYLAELKEYMLLLYDNADISRNSSKESIKVVEPAVSIFGATVDSTITDYISEEMLLDGSAQRYNFVFCETREDKKPLLEHNEYINEVAEEMDRTINNVIHFKYILSEQAKIEYIKRFNLNIKQFPGIAYSFFRRTMFKTLKYALLYHILLKKDNNIIDVEDIQWADRIVMTHFIDIGRLLKLYNTSGINDLIERGFEMMAKYKEQGKELTARDLTRNMRKIKNVSEARTLLDLLKDIDRAVNIESNNNENDDMAFGKGE